MDVIITDHHTLPKNYLPLLPSLIPRSWLHTILRRTGGVGVAYKLLQALLMGVNKEAQLCEVADLVALGTVAI